MENKENLGKFNLGAATLGLFWSIIYKCFLKWFLAFCYTFLIPLIVLVAGLYFWVTDSSGLQELFRLVIAILAVIGQQIISCIVLFVYAGFKGNKWVQNSIQNLDIENYKREQKVWTIVSAAILTLIAVITLTSGLIIGLKIHKAEMAHKAHQRKELKNKCTVVNEIVPGILKETKGRIDKDEFKNKLSNSPKVEIFRRAGWLNDDIYSFSFDVENNGLGSYKGHFDGIENAIYALPIHLTAKYSPECNLTKQNCYIETKLYSNSTESCILYFDNTGNVKPSDYTKKLLK